MLGAREANGCRLPRTSWMEASYNAALKVCMDLNVFDILADHRPGFVSAEAIVKDIQKSESNIEMDPKLLARFLRHLAAMGAVGERDPGEYAATTLTEALRNPPVTGGIDCWFDISSPVSQTLPDFLKQRGHRNGGQGNDCAWQLGKNTDLGPYEYFKVNPRELTSFVNHMEAYALDRGYWTDLYPVRERLLTDADETLPFVVDIGGSNGHDMQRLADQYHISPDRLYVQDLEIVIEPARANAEVKLNFMAHNFFDPQPVKHARAYYIHSVQHNWSDEDCVKMLRHLRDAMKPGYSKILLNEIIIPTSGCDPVFSGLDLLMLGIYGSSVRERSQAEWEELLRMAGLKISGIWHEPEEFREAVIEAELA